MRALWSDRPNCSHNVSQKVKRIRRLSDLDMPLDLDVALVRSTGPHSKHLRQDSLMEFHMRWSPVACCLNQNEYLGKLRKRAEYCCESTVSEKRTH